MNVPIIGQPKIEDWHVTLLLRCTCGASLLFVAQLGSACGCATCKTLYRLDEFSASKDGTMHINLTKGAMS